MDTKIEPAGSTEGVHHSLNLVHSRSPSPPPSSESLSNLHRVTDMLKDKLNNTRMDTSAENNENRSKSPYHGAVTSSAGKSSNGCLPGGVYSLPPHHMSVLLGNDMYNNHNNDSSNVLRGILQGKELEADPEKQQRSGKRFSELYGRPSEEVTKNGSVGGDSDAESFRSRSPGNMSSMDSDPDMRLNGDMDDIMGDSKNSMNGDNEDSYIDGNQDENSMCLSDEESANLKENGDERGVMLSPSGKCSPEGLTPPERRQKRKQYIPQQHGSLEPAPKRTKVEKELFHKQLRQMQEQLSQMQRRYSLFYNGDAPSDIMEDPEAKCKLSDKHRMISPKTSLEIDPSHYIKQASKLVQEQEFMSKHSGSHRGKSPADMQSLARMLKEELAQNVAALVDTVVEKYVERTCKMTAAAPAPVINVPDAKPKKERPPTPEQDAPSTKTKCPTTSNLHHNNNNNNNNNNNVKDSLSVSNSKHHTPSDNISGTSSMSENTSTPKPPRTKVTDKMNHSPFFDFHPVKPFMDMMRAHPALLPPPPYYPNQIPQIQPLYAKEPEQTEAMSLVVGTPTKKKRTKVTDTRLSPRAARALLQESIPASYGDTGHKHLPHHFGFGDYTHPPLLPISLPTSVAIPNPSLLQNSEIMAMYSSAGADHYGENSRRGGLSPSSSPSMGGLHGNMDSFSKEAMDGYDHMMSGGDSFYDGNHAYTTTLTPMHLRKAKLMFFYVRYPSSSILKIYFPDIKFNKNNTAQLVKWFSNFREFYYIQMEKYARQAMAEGVKHAEELTVSVDSELYRILNLHYNRNNQIDVPDTFRGVVQNTLREFFKAVYAGKDSEQSWKKAIYKIIARMDDVLPEYFKSPNWMEQLNDA